MSKIPYTCNYCRWMKGDGRVKEHFSKEALDLWSGAEKKAALWKHVNIAPEHVMLAFFDSANDLATLVVDEFIGSYEKLSSKAAEMINNKEFGPAVTENFLKKVHKEANICFSAEINVPHIMTAVFSGYKEEENIPAQVLQSFGVNIDWFLKLIRFPRSTKKENAQQAVLTRGIFAAKQMSGAIAGHSPLAKYGRDLTSLAQSHELDPVALREKEIDEIIEILCRRVKSNPLLVGEPGVGKSALMTGLAQRMVDGSVPEKLKGIRIFELNLISVIAGASLQGEFEKRLTGIINYVKQEKNIILFIDEIHTIVGTGGVPGMGDAANILKSPLVNGDIKCIGATTMKEYRKYIERDPALARRFQTVEIPEPGIDETIKIIMSIKHLYEEFHHVKLSEEVIRKSVDMSVQHVKDRCLPDKAIDLIDQTCAHVGLAYTGLPAENAGGETLTESDAGCRVVTIEDVATVLSQRTKIPLEKLTSDKLEKLLNLEHLLKKRIVGQDEAIDKVGDIIRLTKSSLDLKPVRPDGVFLFMGPTGVGKTEMARVLSEILFDDESKIIRLDMSEYMEPHSVSKIIGSPPGYIGSDQEGGLTGRVRTEPNSVILLDEVEKAHPDVLNIFLQVFEDGRLTDSQGKTVYFSNSTIIMTSNVGAAQAFTRQREIGFNDKADFKGTENILRAAVKKHFSPEFINRIDEVIYFKPLDRKAIEQIAAMKLQDIKNRFAVEDKVINISSEVLELISEKGYNPEYGARFLNRTIEDMVLKPLSRMLLANSGYERYIVAVGPERAIIFEGEVKKGSDEY